MRPTGQACALRKLFHNFMLGRTLGCHCKLLLIDSAREEKQKTHFELKVEKIEFMNTLGRC
jgi:hypothetical protein